MGLFFQKRYNEGITLDLKTLINSIRNFEGIKRKNMIQGVTTLLNDSYNINGKTVLGFGDDASAIDIDNQQLLLLATDGMWGKLMEADPWWGRILFCPGKCKRHRSHGWHTNGNDQCPVGTGSRYL